MCSGSATGPRAPTASGSGVSGAAGEEEGGRGPEGPPPLLEGTAQRCWAPEGGAAVAERRSHPGGPPLPAGEHLGAPGARGRGGSSSSGGPPAGWTWRKGRAASNCSLRRKRGVSVQIVTDVFRLRLKHSPGIKPSGGQNSARVFGSSRDWETITQSAFM